MKVVIIGNGIAGITAARTIRKKSDWEICVISSETKFFWSRTALMYIFMGHMGFDQTKPYEDHFWKKNKIDLLQDEITSIDFDKKILHSKKNAKIEYDKLLLATGAKPNLFGWPGQNLPGVSGMYSFQDLEKIKSLSKDTREAVIVGGGLIGIELAEMLHSRGIHVTMLIRESGYWRNVLPQEDSELVSQHVKSRGIELKYNCELIEIKAGPSGRVSEILTSDGKTLKCQFVGLTAGVSPNIKFLKGLKIDTDKGILVNKKLETSIPDVYSAGDCAEFKESIHNRAKIEQVWYTGRLQGELAALNMMGADLEYNPGPWYNSAKFFDLEYQTYGKVLANPEKGSSSLIVRPQTEQLIHIAFETISRNVLGINLFGIRHRHEVWDRWLREKRDLDYVIKNFQKADFQPEFSKPYLESVNSEYQKFLGSEKEVVT